MLRFSEELVLLSLDKDSGLLRWPEGCSFDLVLAGALLMELDFGACLDVGVDSLRVIKRACEDDILNEALQTLPEPEDLKLRDCILAVGSKADELKALVLESLVHKGILIRKSKRFLWFFKEQTYAFLDESERASLKDRLRQIVEHKDAIPEPRDVILVSLVSGCGLSSAVFSEAEISLHSERMDQLAKMDLIGQSISKAVRSIQESLGASPFGP